MQSHPPRSLAAPPLCPLHGHLPLQGGERSKWVDQRVYRKNCLLSSANCTARIRWRHGGILPLSPLAGKMSALADRGGAH